MASKQKPRTKPGTFTHTRPQADTILDILRKAGLREDTNHTNIMSQITDLTRLFLMRKAWEAELYTPAAKAFRVKIGRVTKDAKTLLASMEAVIPEAKYSSDGGLIISASERTWYHLTLMGLRGLTAHTVTWGKNFTQRGRRKKEAELPVVRSLSHVYYKATGHTPGRQYDNRMSKECGIFRAFVHAVLKPTGMLPDGTSLDRIIRQVIREEFPRSP